MFAFPAAQLPGAASAGDAIPPRIAAAPAPISGAPAESLGSRLLSGRSVGFGAPLRSLAGSAGSAQASAVLDEEHPHPEFFLRNADNPDEWYSVGGFLKYTYLAGSPMKWSVPISWRYNPTGQPTSYAQTDVVNALIRATEKWEAVCKVRFEYGGVTATKPSMSGCDGQVVVGWSALSGGTVGRTQVCYSSSNLTEFDIVLDNELPLQLNSLSLIETVATHEYGHSLGLGHTSVSPAVMTSSVTTGTPVRDDIDGCVSLYGAPTSTEPSDPSPAVSLSATAMTFATQTVGTTSASKSLRVTNSGGGSLTFSGLSITGTHPSDFIRAGTCSTSTSLGAGQYCDVVVSFSPLAAGTRTASLSVATNAGVRAVALSGTGADPAPIATLNATSVSFGDQAIGTTSAARSVRLTNTGSAGLTLSSVSIAGANAGDFAWSGCGAGTSLSSGAYCTLSVSFRPTASGTRSATLSVASNAPTVVLQLSGNGVSLAPKVSLSAGSIAFGEQVVGTTSAMRTVTLSNTGNAALQISGISSSGTHSAEFLVGGGTCPASGTLAAGASCTIGVRFAPVGTGTRSASVVLTDNASGSPHAIAVAGTGVTAAPSGGVATLAASVDFGDVAVRKTAVRQVWLSNTGTSPFTIEGFTKSGAHPADFKQANCAAGTILAPGAGCSLEISFRPKATGTRSATLSISTSANTPSVALSGNGVSARSAKTIYRPGGLGITKAGVGGRAWLHEPAAAPGTDAQIGEDEMDGSEPIDGEAGEKDRRRHARQQAQDWLLRLHPPRW